MMYALYHPLNYHQKLFFSKELLEAHFWYIHVAIANCIALYKMQHNTSTSCFDIEVSFVICPLV